jgi:hypothetical protein
MGKKKGSKISDPSHFAGIKQPHIPKSDPNQMPDITGPGGRPSEYRKEFDQLLIKHMSQGLSYETFSTITKCDVETMNNWCKEHASFLGAKKEAFAECRLFWEKLGVYYIVEGRSVEIEQPVLDDNGKQKKDKDGNLMTKKVRTKGTEKLNSNIYRLNMANRFKWTNTGSDESDGSNVTVNLHAQIMDAIKEKRKKSNEK